MSYQTEIVIIGAGAAGIAAALTAVDAGKQVILLEKGNKVGGAGFFGAQGLFAVESRQQKQIGEKYSIKEAYEEMMGYTHYRSNPQITHAILKKSANTIDWLAAHGLQTQLVNNTQEVHQNRPKVYHQYIDKFDAETQMIEMINAKGGLILIETTATELVAVNNHITQGKILHDGSRDTIDCKSVIVADGGYIGNTDMVHKYLGIDADNLYSMGERKATGDGIQMLKNLGADIHLGTFENHAASVVSFNNPKWHNDTIFTLTNLPFLWVNRAGERFVDESICYDFALWGNSTYSAGGYYYYLLDQNMLNWLKTHTLNWTDSFERTFKSLAHEPVTHQVGPFKNIENDVFEAVNEKAAWKGDTLSQLAGKLNFNIRTFEKNIDNYNEMVSEGKDTLFYKESKYLKFKIEKGPFYAIRANSTSLGTLGGVKVNARMQALDTDSRPIEGAYVAGNNASGMYDTSYPTIEGISCAFAWNSGRIAAESAVEDL